ncbi:uncharacterized protein LOC122313374 [Carya illinoinensis]|uniref:uncharacterized protein LOC122313374 n=1 Tax=Carya illinoinensis TaxID=32201 RepID=UPI001C723DC4|nr:uncharacterized protein LOC122313374 [Carya illinoinensis]
MANRLKRVMQNIISKNQSAFIPGRLISDNTIAAYETLHSMKTRLKGRIGSMALKLDISKAYDKVEWPFLKCIMEKLGFGARWANLIMECVSSVSYAVLVNGEPGQVIHPTRGLRQGDPLSPYLFLLCAEGLSSLINGAEARGEIKGVAVARGGMKLTHLLFADNCIIFGRACWEEWQKINDILKLYEEASGQSLNKQKTSIMFSSNGCRKEWDRIVRDLGARVQNNCEKYLGLPIMVGRSKYNTFRGIKDRVWLKLSNWKNQFLSPAGKEILLKAVVQAIPTYHMSVFLLPKRLCKEIAGELESFNKALLAKQVWRVLTNPSSVAARILKDKYFKNTSVLNAKLGAYPSMIWRSLRSSIELLKGGLVWRVGNGKSIKIWGDKWIPRFSSFKVQSPLKILEPEAKVEKLIEEGCGRWKADLIKEIFTEEEADLILNTPISQTNLDDKQIWAPSKKAINNCLPTKWNLYKRRVTKDPLCPICVNKEETVCHVLWNCPAAVDVWAEVNSPVQKWPTGETDLGQLWNKVVERCGEDEVVLIATVMRNIWLRRNSLVFEDDFSSPGALFNKAKSSIAAYQEAQEKQGMGAGHVRVHRERVRWRAPREGVVKVNWDAAYELKNKKMGLGVVIRDGEGEVLVSLCKPSSYSVSAAVAEAEALWRAMLLCIELNFGEVVFEGDALGIIQVACSTEEIWEWYGQRLEDIRGLLKRRPLWTVIHTYREGNIVADFLAKFALTIDEEKGVREVTGSKDEYTVTGFPYGQWLHSSFARGYDIANRASKQTSE